LSSNPRFAVDSAPSDFRVSIGLPFSRTYVLSVATEIFSKPLAASPLVASTSASLDSFADDSTFKSTLGMLNGFSFKYRSSIVRGIFYSPLLSFGVFFATVEVDFFLIADLEPFFFDFSFLTFVPRGKV
jgi:hypothetical protein